MQIVKRDGRIVDFDKQKIVNAISLAMRRTEKGEDIELANKIADSISKVEKYKMHIESIQDMVENKLMTSARKDVAQEYIRYRHMRNEYRNQVNVLDKKIDELIHMNQTITTENANKDANVWSTKRDLLAGIAARDYGMRYLLPKEISAAHKEGILHWHDSDYSPMFSLYNCMLIDYKGMFEKGFSIGNAEIESPKSINTATALMAQIVANVSSNIYGGTTLQRVDEYLEPHGYMTYEKHLQNAQMYIETKEKQEQYAKDLTIKSIYDAMQSLEYELNTLYNSNGQTPFVTINFGLGTSWISREIQKAIMLVRLNGLGKSKKTPVFPKLIFTLKDGINLKSNDPNYDIKQLALECTTKRMYPDIINYDKVVEITGDFKSCMGCRSFLGSYKDENGSFITDGRMNMGVVTINLPQIAILSNTTKEFFDVLKDRLLLCKKALLYRISTLNNVTAKNAPILYMYGATGFRLNADDNVSEIFKNGYASISLGYIGIHECATKFFGIDWQKNEEAIQFSLDIIKELKYHTEDWTSETGYGFSVYGTPSESLCDRFCKVDNEKFGSIKHITDKGYYTNSFHYDVDKKITPFEKIDFESKYIPYTSGGFIDYAEFPSLIKNPKALESFWDYCYYKVPYIGTNTPIDKCYECGFEGEFEIKENVFVCPNCGNHNPSTCNCIRRICGYLGDVIHREPNKGKLNEMKHRTKHM